MNKFLTTFVLATLAAGTTFFAASAAHAQWKWKDAAGRTQYSDLPPPASVPDSAIIARPSGATRARPAAAAPAAAAKPTIAAAPKDPQLEARRRELKEAEDAKKRAEQEQTNRQREENCGRARSYAKTLEDGVRVARTNDKGEREFLDDKQRAQELSRAKQVIASDCK